MARNKSEKALRPEASVGGDARVWGGTAATGGGSIIFKSNLHPTPKAELIAALQRMQRKVRKANQKANTYGTKQI